MSDESSSSTDYTKPPCGSGPLPNQPPAPFALWRQAHDEHPTDSEACARRYVELMREHGHIVKAKPGEDRNLPCGWPKLPPASPS